MLGAGSHIASRLKFVNKVSVPAIAVSDLLSSEKRELGRKGVEEDWDQLSLYQGKTMGTVSLKLDGLFLVREEYFMTISSPR